MSVINIKNMYTICVRALQDYYYLVTAKSEIQNCRSQYIIKPISSNMDTKNGGEFYEYII